MVQRKTRFSLLTFLNVLALWPLYLAGLGILATCFGWLLGDSDRIHQGLLMMMPLLMCVVFIAGLVGFSAVIRMLDWCYRKFFPGKL